MGTHLTYHVAINLDEGKIYGMKSHDCHVFMQRLIPLAFRDMLQGQYGKF